MNLGNGELALLSLAIGWAACQEDAIHVVGKGNEPLTKVGLAVVPYRVSL